MISLIGGGWAADARPAVYGPFLAAAGARPTVACVVLDEGDGRVQFERWADALIAVRPCQPEPVLVPAGSRLDLSKLGGADAVLVCGGLTPGYADALAPGAEEFRTWLGERPYAGFSAGAAVAADVAVVGGWRDGEVPVCSEDAGEDLDQVTSTTGLGLVRTAVDVHCARWGTLPRLLAAVRSGAVLRGIGIDEDTAAIDGRVVGNGSVYAVLPTGGEALTVLRFDGGQQLPEEVWP